MPADDPEFSFSYPGKRKNEEKLKVTVFQAEVDTTFDSLINDSKSKFSLF